MSQPLYVVSCVSNPVRFASRYHLYAKFKEHLKSFPQVQLLTVELAFGDRPFEVTTPNERWDLQLRTESEIWHKENLLNLGIERLPDNWRYVAWVDADLVFVDPHWADNTLHELQHYAVVQTWATAIDQGPQGQPMNTFSSFMYNHVHGVGPGRKGKYGYLDGGHPGFGWAATRGAIDTLGGLYAESILGSGDNIMAHALVGKLYPEMSVDFSPGFVGSIDRWGERARLLKRNVGYVPGTILHAWHGPKKARKYWDRRNILVDYKYDPLTDLKPDWQGAYQLVVEDERQMDFRDAIRRYFRQRNEDSIDLEAA